MHPAQIYIKTNGILSRTSTRCPEYYMKSVSLSHGILPALIVKVHLNLKGMLLTQVHMSTFRLNT